MKKMVKWLALIFIVFGIILLLENLNVFLLNWSLYVILTGLAFLLAFFLNKEPVIFIFPATILILYGLLFFYCQISGWERLGILWPILLIAPGLGFIIIHFLQANRTQYLYPGLILSGFGLLFFLRKIAYVKYWPILLIIFGIYLFVKYVYAQK